MKKKFIDVLKEIQPGDIWESDNKTIENIGGTIIVTDKHGNEGDVMVFHDGVDYTKRLAPVTFEEVLRSNKFCMVEHPLLENDTFFKDFVSLGRLLVEIADKYVSEDIRDIMLNGKWYLN